MCEFRRWHWYGWYQWDVSTTTQDILWDNSLISWIILLPLRKDYYPPDAYSQSKLAQILFTRHLQVIINQDKDLHVQVHAAHPGVVDTDLIVHTSITYVPWFRKLFFKVSHSCEIYFFKAVKFVKFLFDKQNEILCRMHAFWSIFRKCTENTQKKKNNFKKYFDWAIASCLIKEQSSYVIALEKCKRLFCFWTKIKIFHF